MEGLKREIKSEREKSRTDSDEEWLDIDFIGGGKECFWKDEE